MSISLNKIHNKIKNINNKEKTILFLLVKKITSYPTLKILITWINQEARSLNHLYLEKVKINAVKIIKIFHVWVIHK